MNYYEILGVSETDDTEAIKRAYRQLAKENHPDLHPGDRAAEARFKDIGEAWDVLGDAAKRKDYDEKRRAANAKASGAGKTARRSGSVRPTGAAGYDDIMSRFGEYFGGENLSRKAREQTNEKAGENPFDTSEFFHKFMGFKK